MNKGILLALGLSISLPAFAADCSKEISSAALKAAADGKGAYVADEPTLLKTTKTGKDEYSVSISNAGASQEKYYIVYTQAGTCNVVGVPILTDVE